MIVFSCTSGDSWQLENTSILQTATTPTIISALSHIILYTRWPCFHLHSNTVLSNVIYRLWNILMLFENHAHFLTWITACYNWVKLSYIITWYHILQTLCSSTLWLFHELEKPQHNHWRIFDRSRERQPFDWRIMKVILLHWAFCLSNHNHTHWLPPADTGSLIRLYKH